MPVKKVYMMTDLEGAAGIDDWDPFLSERGETTRGVEERHEQRRLLTGEVVAAIKGLQSAGVDDILINDSHGIGRTILPEAMPSGVRLLRGKARPDWLVGIDSSFDAFVQVGMHSMTDTPRGLLHHSMGIGWTWRINGVEVGEMEIAAYLAGQLGVPWIFTSGDLHACVESERHVPNIVTAPVKEGFSELCAIHMSPTDARDVIRERIAQAVGRAAEIAPITPAPPVVIEITHPIPPGPRVRPGGQLLDERRVRYTGGSMWEAFHTAYGYTNAPIPT